MRTTAQPGHSTTKMAATIRQKIDKRGALDYFRRAAALGEELLAADPANVNARKDLALMH